MQSMAVEVKQSLPLSVTQLLSGPWEGGAIVQLEDTTCSAKAEDLVLNFSWVRPFVRRFRDRVPSGFFLADTFLFLDTLWYGRLLRPVEPDYTKESLAAQEGKKIKILISCLRALWRSSILAIYVKFLFLKAVFATRTHTHGIQCHLILEHNQQIRLLIKLWFLWGRSNWVSKDPR